MNAAGKLAGIDVSLAEAVRMAARFGGCDPSPVRCGRPAWVPVALVLLEVGRRFLSELDARSRCDTEGGCTR